MYILVIYLSIFFILYHYLVSYRTLVLNHVLIRWWFYTSSIWLSSYGFVSFYNDVDVQKIVEVSNHLLEKMSITLWMWCLVLFASSIYTHSFIRYRNKYISCLKFRLGIIYITYQNLCIFDWASSFMN